LKVHAIGIEAPGHVRRTEFLMNFKAKGVYTDNTNIIPILAATIDMIK
jgi:hypothetical protein